MPLPKLKNSLSVKLTLDSVLQICELVFSFGNCIPKTVSETHAKWSQFGAVSETWGLTYDSRVVLYNRRGFNKTSH